VRILKTSEIGSFVYCRRAWWYQRQGIRTENTAELSGGRKYHSHHGWRVFSAVFLQRAATIMMLAAILVFILYLSTQAH
jgi:hypothetical protein